MFEDMGDSVQTFIFNNFAPAFGDSIRQYLNEFSQKASKLTTTGLVILVLIALMLMATETEETLIQHLQQIVKS